MDNYLKISEKIFNLRQFIEKGQGDMFERKMYLALRKLEDELAIGQCDNCGEYSHMDDLEFKTDGHGVNIPLCVY